MIPLLSHFSFFLSLSPTCAQIEDSYRKTIRVRQKRTSGRRRMTRDLDSEDGESVMVEVLDTAGQQEFASLTDQWIRESQAFIVVYAITSHQSFVQSQALFHRIMRIKGEHLPSDDPLGLSLSVVLVGNKCDLDSSPSHSKPSSHSKPIQITHTTHAQSGQSRSLRLHAHPQPRAQAPLHPRPHTYAHSNAVLSRQSVGNAWRLCTESESTETEAERESDNEESTRESDAMCASANHANQSTAREVSREKGRSLCDAWCKQGFECSFFETSAKADVNCELVFHRCVERYLWLADDRQRARKRGQTAQSTTSTSNAKSKERQALLENDKPRNVVLMGAEVPRGCCLLM